MPGTTPPASDSSGVAVNKKPLPPCAGTGVLLPTPYCRKAAASAPGRKGWLGSPRSWPCSSQRPLGAASAAAPPKLDSTATPGVASPRTEIAVPVADEYSTASLPNCRLSACTLIAPPAATTVVATGGLNAVAATASAWRCGRGPAGASAATVGGRPALTDTGPVAPSSSLPARRASCVSLPKTSWVGRPEPPTASVAALRLTWAGVPPSTAWSIVSLSPACTVRPPPVGASSSPVSRMLPAERSVSWLPAAASMLADSTPDTRMP